MAESIWFDKDLDHTKLLPLTKNTMGDYLGIEWAEITENTLTLTMPVDHRTIQPFGLLHGGASCALAETAGSIASYYCIDNTKYAAVGLEINANHIRSVRSGMVTGVAKPLHLGRNTHVWDIQITNELGKLVCVSRLTVAIVPLPKEKIS